MEQVRLRLHKTVGHSFSTLSLLVLRLEIIWGSGAVRQHSHLSIRQTQTMKIHVKVSIAGIILLLTGLLYQGTNADTTVLLRKPYVQNLQPTALTIVWTTAEAGESYVAYGVGSLGKTAVISTPASTITPPASASPTPPPTAAAILPGCST